MKKWMWLLLVPYLMLSAADVPDPAGASAETADKIQKKRFFTPDEVSEAGVALQNELAEINASLTPSAQTVELEASLPSYIDALQAMRAKIKADKLESYSIKRLIRAGEEASVYGNELDKYETALHERVSVYNDIMQRLKTLETLWTATLQNALNEKAPEAIVARINKSLIHISATGDVAKRAYDSVLTYTDMVVSENRKIKGLIAKLSETRSRLEVRLFVKDSEPLTEAIGGHMFNVTGLLSSALTTAKEIRQTYVLFYKNNIDRLYIHLSMTMLVLALMLYLYVKERRGGLFLQRDEKVRSSILFIRSPVAATIILSVMMVAAIYPDRPVAVAYVNVMIAMTALLVIIYRIAERTLFAYALLLGVLFALGGLINQIFGFDLEIRLIWFGINTVMLLAFYNLVRSGSFLHGYTMGKWMRLLLKLAPVVLILLGGSLAANLFGYYHLAHKLVNATLISLVIFAAFSIVGMVFNGLIVMFVRRRSHDSKHLLEAYARQIENNLKFISNGFLLVYWAYLVLKQFDISYFVKERYVDLMALSWKIGDVVLSVGSLMDFFLVLVVTSFMTRFVRIALDLEVFSRYDFPRGMPTAIQMMVRYLIITIGVLLSLSVLGIKMSDLSLLAGALGVGIGFGLRNIMANFVSGILMIFERPVQLGDVVEVDKIFGDISRIGVRATTIKTYDGSEVIVPNADFITKEVTNWTLSSKLRRVKMAYKVAFGNAPRDVIKIMYDVVITHPDIKDDPAPKVLFEGYGDYYLEFTVYFWVEERLLDVKSETAIAIYEALAEAGINMPVPMSSVRYEGASPAEPRGAQFGSE